MANYTRVSKITFDTSATSPEVIIDPRDKIVAIQTVANYVGITLTAHFSFDNGVTWNAVSDEAGNAACSINDATLANGSAYVVNWDVTNRFKLVSSSAIEAGVVTIISKPRA